LTCSEVVGEASNAVLVLHLRWALKPIKLRPFSKRRELSASARDNCGPVHIPVIIPLLFFASIFHSNLAAAGRRG
jgi:hypothetical protein